jgi:quinol monooxygenase YgiN
MSVGPHESLPYSVFMTATPLSRCELQKKKHNGTVEGINPDKEVEPGERRWILHLRIRVAEENEEHLLAFLREAVLYYEQPGDIYVRLLRSRSDPRRFIEVVEYANRSAHDRDQARVASESRMKGFLERWHDLLEGPVEVEIYEELTELLKGKGGVL